MILARTGDDQVALGTMMAIFGLGGLAGGLLLSVWGGPRTTYQWGVGGAGVVQPARFDAAWAGANGVSLGRWSISADVLYSNNPRSSQAIWQSKVAPDVQGRVFSVRRLMAQITAPVAFLLAGPLADNIFEPAMQPGGSLESAFNGLVGTGTGAGMSLIFIITALLGTVVSLAGYLVPAIRNIEDILPDYDEEPDLILDGTEHTASEQVVPA